MMDTIERTFMMLGAAMMFAAVAAGAFGSHGLSGYFEAHPDLADTYETAVRYHMIHGLALLGVALALTRWPSPTLQLAGWLFVAGTVLFSGSLYVLSLTGVRWLGAVTPIGGIGFLGGWVCLFMVAWRN